MFVITDAGGRKIAALFDDNSMVDSYLLIALKEGYNIVREEGGAEVLSKARQAEPKTSVWQRSATTTKAKPKKAKVKDPFDTERSFEDGEEVKLNWDGLIQNRQVMLEDYKTLTGTVAEVKRGRGVRRGVGVRFAGANEPVWFSTNKLETVQ